MPAQQIAQNLAYINWTVLVGLSLGSFLAVVVARQWTDAPRGYLAFTALCAAAFGVLAWLSDGALTTSSGTVTTLRTVPDPAFDEIRRASLGLLTLAAAAWAISVRRGPVSVAPTAPRQPRIPTAVGLAAAAITLVTAAYGWGPGIVNGLPLLLQLTVLSAATGGVFAAMILGHWYLVTPKLGEQPLILLARLLLWIVGLQLALFLVWVATGIGPADGDGGGPFGALVGPWALFVWLRLIVGIVFPLIVSWAALQTARTRSMESATGLLYINVGSIAAGTILASGLYFGAGLLT